MTPNEGYQIALERITRCKQTRQIWLDLGNLCLEKVPTEINELEWLEELNLGADYQRNKKGKWIHIKRKHNNSLKNNLKKIPLLELIGLKILFLDSNQIKRIKNINKLEHLIHLDLSYNQITKIKNIGKLKNLITINFCFNQITKIENLNKSKKISAIIK